ncbi:MAG: D-2-hydroxyacid dehydrogenase [Phycisphaerales bacterium]
MSSSAARRLVAFVLASVVVAFAAASQSPPGDAAGFWSLRNARVAIVRDHDAGRLTYFAREFAPERLKELREIAPHVEVVVGLTREQALARAAEAQAVDGYYATEEFLKAAKNLRWVQALSAGVDRLLAAPELMKRDDVVLTNFRGVHGPAIADHAFALLLTLTRDMPTAIADRAEGKWRRDDSNTLPRVALAGRTLLVVGLGGIGTEIAQRGHGFGMRVIATRRSDDPAPDYVAKVGKPSDLAAMVAEADVIALAVPLTDETKGLFDAAMFARCKRGAYLINIARGKVVDTNALLEALASGQIAGAGLDVTDPEPLPSDHPLWRKPNVIITPHIAADASITEERGWTVLRENLRRFDAGQPLVNVVDKRAGY